MTAAWPGIQLYNRGRVLPFAPHRSKVIPLAERVFCPTPKFNPKSWVRKQPLWVREAAQASRGAGGRPLRELWCMLRTFSKTQMKKIQPKCSSKQFDPPQSYSLQNNQEEEDLVLCRLDEK